MVVFGQFFNMYGIIYKITNKVNGKVYVGQTTGTLHKRWIKHCAKSTSKNRCRYIYSAIQKYGRENFDVVEISNCETKEQLDREESYQIELSNSLAPNGYNLKTGGHNTVYTEEARKNMSEGRKGKCVGKDNPFFGKTHTEESIKKMSLANIGRPSPRKGIPMKEQQKEKISKANKGKKRSPEWIQKMSKANSVKIICNETGVIYNSIKEAAEKLNLRNTSIGRVLSGARKTYHGYTFSYVETKKNVI